MNDRRYTDGMITTTVTIEALVRELLVNLLGAGAVRGPIRNLERSKELSQQVLEAVIPSG